MGTPALEVRNAPTSAPRLAHGKARLLGGEVRQLQQQRLLLLEQQLLPLKHGLELVLPDLRRRI